MMALTESIVPSTTQYLNVGNGVSRVRKIFCSPLANAVHDAPYSGFVLRSCCLPTSQNNTYFVHDDRKRNAGYSAWNSLHYLFGNIDLHFSALAGGALNVQRAVYHSLQSSDDISEANMLACVQQDAGIKSHTIIFNADTIVGVGFPGNDPDGAAANIIETQQQIADCGFSHTMNYYRELCKSVVHLPPFPTVDFANVVSKRQIGYDFTKTIPIDCVKNSNVPICFIHGAADDFIQPHHSVDMYNVSQNPNSELHLFEGAGHAHSITVDKNRYYKVVCDFLNKIENL